MTNRHKPQIPYVVEELRNAEADFVLLTIQDAAANTEWIENNFPIVSWGRVNWEKVTDSLCINYFDDYELLLPAFEKIVAQQQLEDNQNLIVSWTNAVRLPILIDMKVLSLIHI